MERGGSGDGVCRDGVEGSRRQDGGRGIYVWFVDGGEEGCIREESTPPLSDIRRAEGLVTTFLVL